jgi:hypothetical protein
MASRYVAELAVKPSYRAFRIVGLDDGGRDIVRVDRSGPDGAIRSVPQTALERQADAALQETIKLPAGEVYISPIGLSRENGVIEEPHVPILQVATPLQKPDGTPFGMVIITVDLRPAFTRIRSAANDGLKVFVVNGRGDYLVHPDPAREFGFEIGMPFRVQDDFPDIAPVPDPSLTTPPPGCCGIGPAPNLASAGAPCGWPKARGSRSSKPSRMRASWPPPSRCAIPACSPGCWPSSARSAWR